MLPHCKPSSLSGRSHPLATNSQIAPDLAGKHRLPAFRGREFADAGRLIACATNLLATFRRAATYVDKILKGARPGVLPIEQPTWIELVINLKTAEALGLTIPQWLRVHAELIE